jgi:hypothetical protein
MRWMAAGVAAAVLGATFLGANGIGRADERHASIEAHAVVEVVRDGVPYRVEIAMLLAGDATVDEARAARDSITARFDGGVVVGEERAYAAANESARWMTGAVPWSYNAAGAHPAGSLETIAAAAATWNAAGAVAAFQANGVTSAATGGCRGTRDDANTIGWAPQEGMVLAITCSWFTRGEAVEFDMEIDPSWDWTSAGARVATDFESVILHEFGHALGLQHVEAQEAVMFATYKFGTVKRTLMPVDIATLFAMYGPAAAPSLEIRSGSNLLTWPGAARPPAEAFANADVRAVYSFDPHTGRWRSWAPALPAYANTLTALEQGAPYWVLSDSSATVLVAR